jgi:hypothetical protein
MPGVTRLFLVFVLLFTVATAASPAFERSVDSKAPSTPFGQAEQLVYEGEFSKALLRGADIAELRFAAELRGGVGESPAIIHYKSEVNSKGLLLKLFGISFHQLLETKVDALSHSLLGDKKLDEQGKRKRASETVVDPEKKTLTWTERDPGNAQAGPRVVTIPVPDSIHNIASAIYYLRTQDLQPGRAFEVKVAESGRLVNVPVRVFEKKRMKTVVGNIQTVRVEPGLFGEGGLIRGKGTISIWFTDDRRHVPVKAHISNDLGTVDIKLKSRSSPDSPSKIEIR